MQTELISKITNEKKNQALLEKKLTFSRVNWSMKKTFKKRKSYEGDGN